MLTPKEQSDSELTALLREACDGDAVASNMFFDAVYGELKRRASAALVPHQSMTLSPTVLVHELYEKLVGAQQLVVADRKHFFAIAGKVMRQIIVDHARARLADKRGGDQIAVTLDERVSAAPPTQWVQLNEAIEALAEVDPTLCELTHLRFFAGLSIREIAVITGSAPRSVDRQWTRARTFLNAYMAQD